jgi:SnoaL-like domain
MSERSAAAAPTEIERLLAEHACTKLQMEYGVFADEGNVEALVGLFAPDGSISVPEHPVYIGFDAIREAIARVVAAGTWRHVETNSIVNLTGPYAATGVVYSTVYSDSVPGTSSEQLPMKAPFLVGQYNDVFVRLEAGWRFRSRVLSIKFKNPES